MNRPDGRHFIAAVSLVAVLLATLAPATAAPPDQGGGLRTYRKAAWNLTLRYPAAWRVGEQGEIISFSTSKSEGGQVADAAALTLLRGADYTNLDVTLEDVLQNVLERLQSPMENLSVEEIDPRNIGKVEARGASFSGTDTASGLELQGEIYQLTVGKMGFVAVASSLWDTWETHAPEFNAILDSLQLAGAAVRPTPTLTPTRARSRPTVTPRPTAAPAPAPPPGLYLTAKEAYDRVLSAARIWNAEADLFKVTCADAAWNEDKKGTCREWTLTFSASQDPDKQSEAIDLVVQDGEFLPERATKASVWFRRALPDGAIDSPDAVACFLGNGGQGFLERHADATISQFELENPTYLDAWWILVASTGSPTAGGIEWRVRVNALTGKADTLTKAADTVDEVYISAREAIAAAQAKASDWQADAEIVDLSCWVGPQEPGFADGRCGKWDTEAYSPAKDAWVDVRITDGKAGKPDDTSALPITKSPIKGDWPDTAAVLAAFKTTDDYRAVADQFPNLSWRFHLVGDEKAGYMWKVTADVRDVALTVYGDALPENTPAADR